MRELRPCQIVQHDYWCGMFSNIPPKVKRCLIDCYASRVQQHNCKVMPGRWPADDPA